MNHRRNDAFRAADQRHRDAAAAVDRLFHDEWGYVRSEIAAGTWDATGATPNQIAAAEEYREAVREVERLS